PVDAVVLGVVGERFLRRRAVRGEFPRGALVAGDVEHHVADGGPVLLVEDRQLDGAGGEREVFGLGRLAHGPAQQQDGSSHRSLPAMNTDPRWRSYRLYRP